MSYEPREVADTVLHEGYLLYPYSESALKNRHRYPFGTLYPEGFCRAHEAGDTSRARLECVVTAPPTARVSVQVRFLRPEAVGAVIREVTFATALGGNAESFPFAVDSLRGELATGTEELGGERWKITLQLRNETVLESPQTTTRDQALLSAFASAHLLLEIDVGEFVSAIDPPPEARIAVETCRSEGLWPVLIGTPGTARSLLAAPIVLYDYPELAPESPGDFFDGLEIDELLTLRVLTLTDDEKREMAEGDPRARQLLERTEAGGLRRLAELHGRTRAGGAVNVGTHVRLRPTKRADIMDLALDGKLATVQSVEHDFEGRTYVAVTVDDDPGRDLGAYGHRFFFNLDEIEAP